MVLFISEKLIPLTIDNALNNKEITVYGDGKNIRDWLFVIDHCDAIEAFFKMENLERFTT